MNKFAIVCALLGATAACSLAQAEDMQYPKQSFDATYGMTTPTGKSSMRIASDGKGHVRTESNSAAGKVVSLTDYLTKTNRTALEKQKMIMTVALKPANKTFYDEASAKRAGAKDLGAKKLDGHPCHGFELSEKSVTTQEWIGDDTHYLVHSETTMPTGKAIMSLQTWSNGAPADLMTMPTGYKEIKLPGQ